VPLEFVELAQILHRYNHHQPHLERKLIEKERKYLRTDPGAGYYNLLSHILE
jgi:hypothetical protein